MRRLIAKCPTTGMKSQTCATRAFTIDFLSGLLTGDHTLPSLEHCSVQQTSHPTATCSKCPQMETRDPDSSASSESSHDTGSSAESFGTG